MEARGVREHGHVLQPLDETATVRIRYGETMIGNRPLLGADPHISGFNIFDCANVEEAVEIAAKHPVATFGTLEVRAFADS